MNVYCKDCKNRGYTNGWHDVSNEKCPNCGSGDLLVI